jgi:hypothetical protein
MKVGGTVMRPKSRILLLAGLFTFLVLAFSIPANADPLDTWHVRYPGSFWPDSLSSVAFGNDTFVAVGESGVILTSQDSYQWVRRTSPVDGKDIVLRSVIFANNIFVAVGDRGTILTSPNGYTWKKVKSGISGGRDENHSRTLSRVAYGNGKFVVVGGSGIILTSSDGMKWSRKSSPTTLGLYGLTFGNGIFVAVGHNGTILTSSDGNSWNQQASQDTPWLFCVAYGNGTFVAAGGGVFTSPDGITWTPRTSPLSGWFYDAIFANNIFVMVGHDGIMTSPNGDTWTFASGGYWQDIIFANNTFVALGEFGSILTSPDLFSWTARQSPLTIKRLRSVAFGHNFFVAVGGDENMNYGAIATSFDGISWVERLRTEYGLSSVVFGNNTFVAVGHNGTIFTSPDGITWTQIESPTWSSLFAVTYDNNTFVAVGWGGKSITSLDGTIWAQNTPTNVWYDLYGIAFGNNTFVAVGGSDYGDSIVETSPDGITWTERTSSTNVRLLSVVFGNNTFVAVGGDYSRFNGIDNPTIVTSPDGVTWTTKISLQDIGGYYDVTFANNLFMVVGSCGQIFTSPDGLVWTPRKWEYFMYGCYDFFGVTFGNNTFLTVGQSGQWGPYVVQSDPVAGEYYNLIVDSFGPGTVTNILPGINCRRDCSETFFQNTQVALLATPNLNSAFTGWTGCDLVDGYFCTVIMNNAKNVSAGFITVDFTGPTLVIRKPADSKTLNTATTFVSGTATDSKKGNNGIVQVMVNGERAVNDTAEGKQKAKWSATVHLELGDNIITVAATDSAGNTTTTTRTVTRFSESLAISSGIAQNN